MPGLKEWGVRIWSTALMHSRGRSGFCYKLPTTALDTRPSPDNLSDNFDTDATEPAPGRRHLVESCAEDGSGSTSFLLAGWTAHPWWL